jgi:hypothetical protein
MIADLVPLPCVRLFQLADAMLMQDIDRIAIIIGFAHRVSSAERRRPG